jgi:hypothetical protein
MGLLVRGSEVRAEPKRARYWKQLLPKLFAACNIDATITIRKDDEQLGRGNGCVIGVILRRGARAALVAGNIMPRPVENENERLGRRG